MNRLADRTIIVTGAGSGIGRATALRLATEGAYVAALDVVPAGLEGLADEFDPSAGGTLVAGPIDIADEESVVSTVAGVVAERGQLDALVNTAGIHYGDHTHQMTLERWNRLLTVNLTGTFLMTREALPHLVESQYGGRLVNFASTSSFFAHPYMAAYAASKGAIMAFTHSVALEYAHKRLRAVNICPGGIETGITANTMSNLPEDIDFKKFTKIMPTMGKGEFGNPDNIAGVVAMVISPDGDYISGTEIRVDGGTHM
jgi:NAD(P)-dependent dehydrogenase (short-subunit alcohol dehydrogenase family)